VRTGPFELPPEKLPLLGRAKRLEWLTIAHLLVAASLMYAVTGSSQAMRATLVDDVLSLIPPCVFLVAVRNAARPSSRRFPYGHHRAVSIAFLCAAVALCAVGGLLLGESVAQLVQQERPSIGGVRVLGHTIWQGWLMLPALAWSALPHVLLGRAKLPLARALHDKVLHADSEMNRAEWLGALAAAVGVLGSGFGLWWMDALAGGVIALGILHDGASNLREVVANLMDQTPKTVDRSAYDALPERVEAHLRALPWVVDASVRMREAGHVFFGEAFVVVSDERDLVARLEDAARACRALDWRVHELDVIPVRTVGPGRVERARD
jgi:cation diffusion facilitator family transporter